MPDNKLVNKAFADLKANKETYNRGGKLTSFFNGKTANIKKKQQEIKEIEEKKQRIKKIAKPIIKELYKNKYNIWWTQFNKKYNKMRNEAYEIKEKLDRQAVNVEINTDGYFIDFDETSNSMNLFDNYEFKNNNQLPKDLRELQKAANKKGVINVNSDECFIDFDETSNSMNLFHNYESYRNKIDANNSKIKNLYRRSFKKGDNPVSKMYRLSKNRYKKKNNAPCILKNPLSQISW